MRKAERNEPAGDCWSTLPARKIQLRSSRALSADRHPEIEREEQTRFLVFHRSGITLVEVIIALAILSVVMLSALAVMKGTSQSWRRGEVQTDAMQRARGVADQIARQLATAVATPWGDVRFEGTEDSVHFVTIMLRPGHSDLVEAGFWFENRELFYHSDREPDFDFDTGESESLVSGVASLTFAYYDGASWRDAWNGSEQALPKAVRVSIELEAGDGAKSYETIVQLRTTS